jgi:hypothetical protein
MKSYKIVPFFFFLFPTNIAPLQARPKSFLRQVAVITHVFFPQREKEKRNKKKNEKNKPSWC